MTAGPVVKRHIFTPEFGGDPAFCQDCGATSDGGLHLAAVELSDIGLHWHAELATVDAAIATLNETLLKPLEERRMAALRNLQAEIGEAEAATIGGRPVITWVWSKPADGIDLAGLRRDHPEIFEVYYRPKKAARPFKVVAP